MLPGSQQPILPKLSEAELLRLSSGLPALPEEMKAIFQGVLEATKNYCLLLLTLKISFLIFEAIKPPFFGKVVFPFP